MSKYFKPQKPLQNSQGDFIYPLTFSDQVIMEDGQTRLSGRLSEFYTKKEINNLLDSTASLGPQSKTSEDRDNRSFIPPKATSSTLGGVKAFEKTSKETVQCKIGSDGFLYVPENTSSTKSDFKDDIKIIYINEDPNFASRVDFTQIFQTVESYKKTVDWISNVSVFSDYIQNSQEREIFGILNHVTNQNRNSLKSKDNFFFSQKKGYFKDTSNVHVKDGLSSLVLSGNTGYATIIFKGYENFDAYYNKFECHLTLEIILNSEKELPSGGQEGDIIRFVGGKASWQSTIDASKQGM